MPPGYTDHVEHVLHLRYQRCLNGVTAGRTHDLYRDPVDRQVRPEQQNAAPTTPEQGQKA
jgi:hypothetical protein